MCKDVVAPPRATKRVKRKPITSYNDVSDNKLFDVLTDGMEDETDAINRMV